MEQESIQTKHKELLALQNNAPEILNLKSSELIETEQIEDSALHFVKISPENEPEKWFIALGKKRLTDYYQTKEECEKCLNTWRFWIDLQVAITQDTIEYGQFKLDTDGYLKPTQ